MKVEEKFESFSVSRYNRVSPFKVRRIINQLRGRSVLEAIMILEFMPYKSCDLILRVLLSAIANAKSKFGSDKKWFISAAWVDEGPVLKRFRPRAQGRGFPIKKRMCHITIRF